MECLAMGQGDRIRTFIHGFDDKLGGGIPEGHVVLLAGEPGTMKSTIAFNMMYQNALRDGRPGTYISLEQGRENLTRHLDQMSLSPRDVESKVSIVDLGMIRRNLDGMADRTWLEIFKMYAMNLKRSLNYDILVVDSLPVLEVMSRFENPREDLFQLFEWIRDLKATTILISEMKPGSEDFGKNGEEYLSDGIIHTKMERVDDANIQRRIRCVKLRGTNHSRSRWSLSSNCRPPTRTSGRCPQFPFRPAARPRCAQTPPRRNSGRRVPSCWHRMERSPSRTVPTEPWRSSDPTAGTLSRSPEHRHFNLRPVALTSRRSHLRSRGPSTLEGWLSEWSISWDRSRPSGKVSWRLAGSLSFRSEERRVGK